jgi:hypothetical protein
MKNLEPIPRISPGLSHPTQMLSSTGRDTGDGLALAITARTDDDPTYRLCYVRGPEGIIVELAEQIG